MDLKCKRNFPCPFALLPFYPALGPEPAAAHEDTEEKLGWH
jgi:hypothetical protein